MRISRVVALVVLLGPSHSRAELPVIDERNVFDFYRTFVRLTKEPHQVQPSIATLCTTPNSAAIDAVKRATGPHFETRVHFYANEPAAQRTRKTDTFTPGATIVKTKLGTDDSLVLAVGGMRKREPGYDPANGDWEYFYAAKAGGFSIGKLASCIQCHGQTKNTDYVFGRWPAPKEP